MLRITNKSDGINVILNLEGSLAGPWVKELEREWHQAAAGAEGRPIRLFLIEVTFIDAAGKRLLEEMCRQGVEFVGAGCMNRAIVEEIIHRKERSVCGGEEVSSLKKIRPGDAGNGRGS